MCLGSAHPGPRELPTVSFSSVNQCSNGTNTSGSYCDCKMPFNNKLEETLERYRFIMRSGNYVAHLGPHSEVTGREGGEGERERRGLGSACIGV